MKELNETPRNLRAVWVPMTLTALVMTLLIAAAVTANPTQAQGVGIGGDLNKINYTPPFPCDGEDSVPSGAPDSVDDGHYAAFDAFWDYNNSELSNNFCPPAVVHTEEEDEETGEMVEVTTREASNIDIRKTVFSIPDSHKANIVNSTSSDAENIGRGTYQFLSASSTEVWWLKADDDATLVMGFSAGLLKEDHWAGPAGAKAVHYEFEARERPACPDPSQEAHFYVFQDSDAPVAKAKWDSSKPDEADLELDPGEYEHYNWVFTCPGTYRVQIQFKGYPSEAGKSALGIGSNVTSETSVARLYTFHVGPEDDLGVSITPKSQAVAASATSTSFTVNASNSGPDNAHDAEVQIYLPEGLGYVADSSHTGVTYDSGSGVIAWDLRRFGRSGNSDTSTFDIASPATLNFSASIDRSKATGTVAVRAEIRNVASGDLDSNSANNVSFAAVRLSSTAVHPPIFTVTREIEEFASSFEPVGEPITAFSPERRNLTYSLSGRGHEKFRVLGNGQIIVANNVVLEYEKQWSYWLTLKASDGTNSDTILVKIRVVNVPEPKVRMWVQDERPSPSFDATNLMHPSASGGFIGLYAVVHNLPAGKSPSGCTFKSGAGATEWSDYVGGYCTSGLLGAESAGPGTYTVGVSWSGGSAFGIYTVNWAP